MIDHSYRPGMTLARRCFLFLLAAALPMSMPASADADEAKPVKKEAAAPATSEGAKPVATGHAPADPGQDKADAKADAKAKAETDRVEITKSASSWDNLSELFLSGTPAEPFGEGSVFVMRGELRNRSTEPVGYVVLRYELLDEKGKVLQDMEGYNQSAEGMRPDEEGNIHPEKVKPIPAGGVDTYRMVFFHDEVPKFAKHRVRVTEIHNQGASKIEQPAAAKHE
ncbi:MAG: FxLYD domain-containing protein [Vicinamibacterales bacterium]